LITRQGETKMKAAIYAENIVECGRICRNEDKIEQESDDLVIYEGSPREILRMAVRMRLASKNAPAGRDRFLRRAASSLRDAARAEWWTDSAIPPSPRLLA
jgi:hypothetical protein